MLYVRLTSVRTQIGMRCHAEEALVDGSTCLATTSTLDGCLGLTKERIFCAAARLPSTASPFLCVLILHGTALFPAPTAWPSRLGSDITHCTTSSLSGVLASRSRPCSVRYKTSCDYPADTRLLATSGSIGLIPNDHWTIPPLHTRTSEEPPCKLCPTDLHTCVCNLQSFSSFLLRFVGDTSFERVEA